VPQFRNKRGWGEADNKRKKGRFARRPFVDPKASATDPRWK
jgi:hypothetical protein